jgi:hypothetical protein
MVYSVENIVWVITIKCTSHNSHGSWFPYTNSQGTLSQQPWDIKFTLKKKLIKKKKPQHPSMVVEITPISLPLV